MTQLPQASLSQASSQTAPTPTIGAAGRGPLSGDRERIVQTAMAFPMDKVLKRYAKDQDLPWDVVLEHEREIKRYLALVAMNSDKMVGMNGIIDELWHTFIMFTRDYNDFSLLVAGHYIHHTPAGDDDDAELGQNAYQLFWDEYTAVFGEEPPSHLWPRPIAADTSVGGCSCVARGEGTCCVGGCVGGCSCYAR